MKGWLPIDSAPSHKWIDVSYGQKSIRGGHPFRALKGMDGVWINSVNQRIQTPLFWFDLPDPPIVRG